MTVQEDSVHDSLAVAIANEILSDPDTVDVRVYCRSLSTMELTSTNEVYIQLAMCNKCNVYLYSAVE